MHALGHRIVDDMLLMLQNIRSEPVWRPMPDAVAARLQEPVPRTGIGAERAMLRAVAQ